MVCFLNCPFRAGLCSVLNSNDDISPSKTTDFRGEGAYTGPKGSTETVCP